MFKLKEKEVRKRKQDEINQGGSPKVNGGNLYINTTNIFPTGTQTDTPTSAGLSSITTPTSSTSTLNTLATISTSINEPLSPPTKKTKVSQGEIVRII